jgi:hypothetical protein
MQAFVYDEVNRIEFDDGEWVDIKQQMNYGDQQRLAASYVKAGRKLRADEDTDLELDLEAGNLTLLLINIKAWSFKDSNGKIAPINKETIGNLHPKVAERLLEEIGKGNPVKKA